MKPAAPEFSRPLQVDRVPALGSHENISATPQECAAVAARLDLPAVHSLAARLKAEPWRGGLKLTGRAMAEVERESVISLVRFRSTVEFPVERYFSADAASRSDSEEELDPIIHGHVDLGEVAVETLALELDPYPRLPGEQFSAPQEPDPPKPNPFDALRRLKS